MIDDARSAVRAHRAQVLAAAGRALDRSLQRRRMRRRLGATGAVVAAMTGALVVAWPRQLAMPRAANVHVDFAVLRGGASHLDFQLIAAGDSRAPMLLAIDDDELEEALLGAVGERRADVGVIRRRGSIEVVDSSTGLSVALGTPPAGAPQPRWNR